MFIKTTLVEIFRSHFHYTILIFLLKQLAAEYFFSVVYLINDELNVDDPQIALVF